MKSRIQELYETRYSFPGANEFKAYERNRLLPRVAKSIVQAGQTLLDLGCNDGTIMFFFQELGCQVSGIDISEVALSRARSLGLKDLKQGNVEDPLPWPDQVFDHVFWGDNIEHLFEPMPTLIEIKRVLKIGGCLWISTPNLGYWKARLYALIRGCPMRMEGHDNPPWAWEHIRFFNQPSLDRFLVAGGLQPVAHLGAAKTIMGQGLAHLAPSLFSSILLTLARKNA